MTVAELYRSVAQLGFEDSLEYEEGFILAANRALLQVSALRPSERTCVINHRPLDNLIHGVGYDPIFKSDDIVFEAVGVCSYYFEACGYGIACIELLADTGEWEVLGDIQFETEHFTAFRGHIKRDGSFVDGRIRLRFTGEYAYTIKCVAMYAQLIHPSEDRIPPFSPVTKYDMSGYVDDYLSLVSLSVRDREAKRVYRDYYVENGRMICLYSSAPGAYEVTYIHKPTPLEYDAVAAEDDTLIDLDEDLCSVLPLLVASYIWIDDEPEKAQYYLALYRERAADVLRKSFPIDPVAVVSSNGW